MLQTKCLDLHRETTIHEMTMHIWIINRKSGHMCQVLGQESCIVDHAHTDAICSSK